MAERDVWEFYEALDEQSRELAQPDHALDQVAAGYDWRRMSERSS